MRWRLKWQASRLFTESFTFKLRVTGLCAGNSPLTGEFPAQSTGNAKNVFIWWRHHDIQITLINRKPPFSRRTYMRYLTKMSQTNCHYSPNPNVAHFPLRNVRFSLSTMKWYSTAWWSTFRWNVTSSRQTASLAGGIFRANSLSQDIASKAEKKKRYTYLIIYELERKGCHDE